MITCQTVEVAARLRDAAVQLRITNSFAPSALFAPAFFFYTLPQAFVMFPCVYRRRQCRGVSV